MKKFLCLVLSFIFAFSVFTINTSASTKNMKIYGLHLSKTGDATLIESHGYWTLVDTGSEGSSEELLQKLSYYGVKELRLVISHYHSDHIGGMEALANSDIKIVSLYLPDVSLIPYYEHTEYFQNKIIELAENNNPDVNVYSLKVGEHYALGGWIVASVLGPVSNVTPDDLVPTNDQTQMDKYVNNRSLTIRFSCSNISFLSCGDIEKEEEKALVSKYGSTGELDADIMKLSHHALPTSNSEEFLAAVSPRYTFAHNSEKTFAEGSVYRMYYNSCKNASKYGPVYLIGDEKQDFGVRIVGEQINIYKGSEELKGLVTLTGGDGTKVKDYKYYINGGYSNGANGGHVEEGVYTIDDKKYYISDGGFVNKAFYSFNNNAYVYRYETPKSGDIRYLGLDGQMYLGFRKINDYYYYFNTQTGVMVKGDADYTPVSIGSKKYAINQNGVIYNYGKSSGAWKKYGSKYRYFDKNGVMKTGWLTVGGKKYYLNEKTGYREVGLKTIGSKTYYFVETNKAAYVYTKGWKKFGSKYRYFDKNGVMKTGWLTVGGKKYYLNKKTGYREVGLKKIGSKKYYFVETNKAAYVYTKGWKKFGSKYRYFDKKGVMKTGWIKVGGKNYYLDKSTGYRAVGLKKIGKKTYYFVEKNKAGYRYSGWKKFGKKKRYFDSKGVMATGTKKIKGKTYKFDKKGYLK